MDRLAYKVLAGPRVRLALALWRPAPALERLAQELERQRMAAPAVACCAVLGGL